MIITPWTVQLFEKALNRYLNLDPEASRLLKPLNQGVLCYKLGTSNETIYFYFSAETITVNQTLPQKIDATITATPLALARYIADQDKQFSHDDILIEGKIDFVQKVQKLFSSIDIDWEEQLAALTNDHIAHTVGRLSKQLSALARDATETVVKNTSEYLVEEARVIVSKEEIHHFCQDVDAVSMAADRLAARLNFLEKKVKNEKR